ncbi:DsbA family protein [Ktedonobacteria bacterium brp13]|nr:DsbA family protein [Ktedonobacteria bacterium brp13]
MSTTQTQPAHIQFHFDPLCPFAWRTALWAREARKVRPIDITWRFFSLEIANRPEGKDADYVNGMGWAGLRTLALVRRKYGNEAVEKLYIQLGNAQHGRKESIRDRAGVEAAAQKAGYGPEIVAEALADESTAQDVLRDHEEAVQRYHAFGVPTVALDGSDIGVYGPVIIDVPQGEEAGEMWDHFHWALQTPNLFELKRDRAGTSLEPVSAE